MKKSQNFRLQQSTIATIEAFSKKSGDSKTDIVEKAIRLFVGYESKRKNELLSLAGSVSSNQMDKIMDTIKVGRKNKKIKISI